MALVTKPLLPTGWGVAPRMAKAAEPRRGGGALTPGASLPVLLPHGQQLLHAVVHGLGELADGVALLFSEGQTHKKTVVLGSAAPCPCRGPEENITANQNPRPLSKSVLQTGCFRLLKNHSEMCRFYFTLLPSAPSSL